MNRPIERNPNEPPNGNEPLAGGTVRHSRTYMSWIIACRCGASAASLCHDGGGALSLRSAVDEVFFRRVILWSIIGRDVGTGIDVDVAPFWDERMLLLLSIPAGGGIIVPDLDDDDDKFGKLFCC